jgi:23S rRNA (guanosine2251-2'-O)-methyltransferase
LLRRTTAELRAAKWSRDEFVNLPRRPITLVLSGLKMENLGSVFRVADAARIEKLVLCGVPYTPESLRFRKAAKGTHRWVPHDIAADAVEVVRELKEQGRTIVALEQAVDAMPYDRAEYPFPVALVIGSERDGVREELLSLADVTVELPMDGMCNSLNVAVATGILVYRMVEYLEAQRGPA